MRIETDRLIITEFDLAMAESVHRNSLDEDTRRFVPDEVFETVEEAWSTIDFLISRYESADGPWVYPVLLKNGANIGYVQLTQAPEGWEIGYHIAKAHTGRGYASEAVTAFLSWVGEEKRIDEVLGICMAENIASAKVLQKCGFELLFEGIGDYQSKRRRVCKYLYKKRRFG